MVLTHVRSSGSWTFRFHMETIVCFGLFRCMFQVKLSVLTIDRSQSTTRHGSCPGFWWFLCISISVGLYPLTIAWTMKSPILRALYFCLACLFRPWQVVSKWPWMQQMSTMMHGDYLGFPKVWGVKSYWFLTFLMHDKVCKFVIIVIICIHNV